MRAFHGNTALKQMYLKRVRYHQEAGDLVRGCYWENGKGCAVGCTIHDARHANYEIELGIPQGLAYLEDALFETIPAEKVAEWPERFLEAIPVGADLSSVIPHLLRWVISDDNYGVVKYVDEQRFPRICRVIRRATECLDRLLRGESVDERDWESVRSIAVANTAHAANLGYVSRSSAANAAYAAAYAAHATYAAAAAALTGFSDAAPDDGADAAAQAAARHWATRRPIAITRSLQAEKLLAFLSAAPVITVVERVRSETIAN